MSQGCKGSGRAKRKGIWPWMLLLGLLWVAAIGCGPDYPNCENDDDCANTGEVCGPKGQCTACVSAADCGGDCAVCRDGRCGRSTGCCTSDDDCSGDRPFCSKTPQNEKQQKLCVSCLRDSNCKQQGHICEKGACVAPACSDTEPCPDFQVCDIEAKRCVMMRLCEFKEVFFHTGRHEIPDDQTPKLASNKACFDRYREATGDRIVLSLSGHADERGEDNANMRLSERRSQSILKALQKLGLPAGKVRLRAAGEREPLVPQADSAMGHQWNRRVEFTLR